MPDEACEGDVSLGFEYNGSLCVTAVVAVVFILKIFESNPAERVARVADSPSRRDKDHLVLQDPEARRSIVIDYFILLVE